MLDISSNAKSNKGAGLQGETKKPGTLQLEEQRDKRYD